MERGGGPRPQGAGRGCGHTDGNPGLLFRLHRQFEPTGHDTDYQYVREDFWPSWGGDDLAIGESSGAPGGTEGSCQWGRPSSGGPTFRGRSGEVCGGQQNWGPTEVEVWYPDPR